MGKLFRLNAAALILAFASSAQAGGLSAPILQPGLPPVAGAERGVAGEIAYSNPATRRSVAEAPRYAASCAAVAPVIRALQAQGFSAFDVAVGPSQARIAAIRGDVMNEFVYDCRTGQPLSQRGARVPASRAPGITYAARAESRDFVDLGGAVGTAATAALAANALNAGGASTDATLQGGATVAGSADLPQAGGTTEVAAGTQATGSGTVGGTGGTTAVVDATGSAPVGGTTVTDARATGTATSTSTSTAVATASADGSATSETSTEARGSRSGGLFGMFNKDRRDDRKARDDHRDDDDEDEDRDLADRDRNGKDRGRRGGCGEVDDDENRSDGKDNCGHGNNADGIDEDNPGLANGGGPADKAGSGNGKGPGQGGLGGKAKADASGKTDKAAKSDSNAKGPKGRG